MKFRSVKLLLLAIAFYALARFCHHQTSGFKMSKVRENCAPKACLLEQPPPSEELKEILQGRFTYFGRGLQSFAFLSEDGKYVLKLFNNRLQRRIFWFDLLGQQERSAEAKEKLEKIFNSYKIASEELSEATGLIYLHSAPTQEQLRPAILIDRLGIEHPVDLNKTGFLLQKRATLAYPWLKELIEQGKNEDAKEAISSLVAFFVEKSKRGIADNDPLIRTNFGFIDNHPIQIDVGPFSKDDAVQNPEVFLPELKRIMASLRHWLKENGPELIEYLDNCLEDAEKNY